MNTCALVNLFKQPACFFSETRQDWCVIHCLLCRKFKNNSSVQVVKLLGTSSCGNSPKGYRGKTKTPSTKLTCPKCILLTTSPSTATKQLTITSHHCVVLCCVVFCRQELVGRYRLESPELREVLARECARSEASHKQELKRHQARCEAFFSLITCRFPRFCLSLERPYLDFSSPHVFTD